MLNAPTPATTEPAANEPPQLQLRSAAASISTTSQHLAKLRLAGIVSARRAGRHTYYTVEDPHVLTMLDQIFGHIAPDGTLAPDPVTPPCRDPGRG